MENKLVAIKNDNLKQSASKGAFWGLSGNLTVSAISFVGTAILARILSPKDFGLLGMAVLITGVVQLFGNLGLGAALVQKKNIDDEYLSTAFWSSLFVSGGLAAAAIILAPFASIFFNESIIKWIIVSLSATFVISSFSSIHRTLLYKEIKMKKIALIEITSRSIRVIIMLVCAVAGMGFWSIVIGMIVESILKTILFTITAHWMPAFRFSTAKFKELFAYGKHLYGQGFLAYFSSNMDFIVTGRVLGVQLLGFYQFSYNLPYLVRGYVQDGLAPIAFPVFSKVNDDKERLARGLFSAVKYISMMTFPIMFGLAFCANDFVAVVYGAKWLPAAQPLRILCFAAALGSVHCIVGSVFSAVGRPDIGFKWDLFKLPVTIVSVLLLSRWGIIGIAFAMFFVECLTIFIAYVATKILNVRFKTYLITLLPAICGSMIMLTSLYLINKEILATTNTYFRFASNIVLGAVIYVASLLLVYKKDVLDAIEFIRLSLKSV